VGLYRARGSNRLISRKNAIFTPGSPPSSHTNTTNTTPHPTTHQHQQHTYSHPHPHTHKHNAIHSSLDSFRKAYLLPGVFLSATCCRLPTASISLTRIANNHTQHTPTATTTTTHTHTHTHTPTPHPEPPPPPLSFF
jgi:hypothetical protein